MHLLLIQTPEECKRILIQLFLSTYLERALDLNSKGPLTLLTHYQTPTHLRRAGHTSASLLT
jgi:hypothetical protein